MYRRTSCLVQSIVGTFDRRRSSVGQMRRAADGFRRSLFVRDISHFSVENRIFRARQIYYLHYLQHLRSGIGIAISNSRRPGRQSDSVVADHDNSNDTEILRSPLDITWCDRTRIFGRRSNESARRRDIWFYRVRIDMGRYDLRSARTIWSQCKTSRADSRNAETCKRNRSRFHTGTGYPIQASCLDQPAISRCRRSRIFW